MDFNQLKVFYFSGTGNARHVVYWIEALAKAENLESKIIDISKLKSRRDIQTEANNLIGFCSPTHGFNFPPIMFHFILRFPRSKGNRVFIINTRAGMKMGKYFLPGLSGIAQYFSAFVLWLKGYKIIGMHPIDLPSNWISFHPGLKPKVVESIYGKRKQETELFAQKILSGKTDRKALRDLIQDIAITPVAALYYTIGRFILAKSFYASRDCTNCMLCVNKCPVQAIKVIDKRPFWTYKCESCMQCINICPERAIETAHGFVIGSYYLISFVLLVLIYKWLEISSIVNRFISEWLSGFVQFFIDVVLILLLFFSFYRIFHYLLRFKPFERLIYFTSLTRFKFWRRYKTPNMFNV
ncbi:MAG TPA: EFR1 family ferrodoxin [Bacteroidales bacterium]|nr:EFR1 family ferrodoxin [Bacteroidales bacterium]